MAGILTLVGSVAIPAGATDGDVIFRHIGVVRGGARVAGGSFLGRVDMTSGELRGLDGQPVKVPVLFPGDFTEQHPYLEISISWRGQGVGYSFMVDLLLPADHTAIDIREASGGGKPVVVAEQVRELQAMLNRGDALLPELEKRAQVAATAADFAYGAVRGRIYDSYVELESDNATDGVWGSVGLHTFFRRENGQWIPKMLGRMPVLLGDALPSVSAFWTNDVSETKFGIMKITYQAKETISFDTLEVPTVTNLMVSVCDDRGVELAKGKLVRHGEKSCAKLGRVLAFYAGQSFTLVAYGDDKHGLYGYKDKPYTSDDGRIKYVSGPNIKARFVQGEFFPAEVAGTLRPDAFPVVKSTDALPAGGVARVGTGLFFRTLSGELVEMGGGGGSSYTSDYPLPLKALEQGDELAKLPSRVTALEGKSSGLSTVATTANLRGDGTSGKPLDVSADLASLPARVVALESRPAGGDTASTPSGLIRLSTPAAMIQRSPRVASGAALEGAASIYRQFTPTSEVTLVGLHDNVPHNTEIYAAIWDAATQQRIAISAAFNAPATAQPYDVMFTQPVTLSAGKTYLIGLYSPSGQIKAAQGTEKLSYAGFTLSSNTYYDPSRKNYPTSIIGNGSRPNQFGPTFDLLQLTNSKKGVVGPLDAADMPLLASTADLVAASWALLDDGAGPPRLIRKRADGTLWYGAPFTTTA